MPPEIKTSPGFAIPFQARRDVTITINVIRLDNDVAEVDADPIENTLIVRLCGVTDKHALLNHDRATNRFNRAVKHRQKTIARVLNECFP